MVLAEKIVTALERGEQNTRWRDFTDIASIAGSRTIDGSDLQEAIELVACYRQIPVQPLAPLVAGMPALVQRKWAIWRRKQQLEKSTPESFNTLLQVCLKFSEPALARSVGEMRWDPIRQAWCDKE